MRSNRATFYLLPLFALVLTGSKFFGGDASGTVELASQARSNEELAPMVFAAFEQIQRAHNVNKIMDQGPTPPRASAPVYSPPPTVRSATAGSICTDCNGPRVSDVRYMQCNSRNNYFENRLASLRSRGGLVGDLLKGGAKANTILKPVCLRVSLESRFGAHTPTFASCGPGDGKARANQIRPCVSENYFALMNNSFDLVARCMGPMLSMNVNERQDDIRLMFGMLNIESGLHANAMSPTGAGGVGQFTSDAIEDVNDNDIPVVRQKLNAMGGECARLSSEILNGRPPMRASSSLSCDRVSLERGNPLLNFVYIFSYISRVKREISRDFLEDRRYGRFFSALSSADKNRLRTVLTMWSHNTGPAGLRTPLLALLNSRYRGGQVTNATQFINELAQAMRDYPHRANSSNSRRRETSNYWPAVATNLSKIERNAGGGSCVQR